MTHAEIAQQRLRNQQIANPAFTKADEVVRWMGAVQAQHYLASLWAVGVRMAESAGVAESDIEQAIADKKIIRTWPMRGTLHFVAAEDVRWMQELLTPRVIRSFAGRHRELGLDETIFKKSRNLIEHALQGGKQLINAELYEVLEQSGIPTDGQRGYHILGVLAQKGVLCLSPRRGKQQTYTLLDEWLPETKSLNRDEALAELGCRYITSHGPATDYDFAAWSGLTMKDARTAFKMNRSKFEQTEVDGNTFWFPGPASASENPSSNNTYLLPAFDEMLCGYKDRSAILRSEHQTSIILKNGIFKPLVMLDGCVAGSWKRTLKKESVVIELDSFDPLPKNERIRIEQAAKPYGPFLGRNVEFSAYDD